jgi:ribonuclease G
MSTELIINASLPETRIALLENGEIQELLIERASGKGIVGNIYKGRVTRVLPGMQAAFVDIGLEKAAFLYVDDVFVHSEVWEEEEAATEEGRSSSRGSQQLSSETSTGEQAEPSIIPVQAAESTSAEAEEGSEAQGGEDDFAVDEEEAFDDDADEDSDDEGPVGMTAEGGEGESGGDAPEGTVAPAAAAPAEGGEQGGDKQAGPAGESDEARRRRRRGRRGGRNRRRGRDGEEQQAGAPASAQGADAEGPEAFSEHIEDEGHVDSDRSELGVQDAGEEDSSRPRQVVGSGRSGPIPVSTGTNAQGSRPEFRENRDKNRRIKPKAAAPRSQSRAQVNIQDLLKEGQEVLVQVAKDPIATKGARLTCHISLPGRHLVCMPTIDHVGVSRRIERDDERRRLRDFVERNRPKALGFIVRTASGKQSEKRVKQDIEYLTRLWGEIQEKARTVSAPALVYEDLNAVLRSIRDWVNEEIDKIVVDSRYHFNDIQRFVSHFMPSLRQKAELYQGDVPIFDAYNISSELSRALERKVWLKSGGYLVIDQAEALVAIDVNTGRFVGKKNLEDTILKTNLEAVQEIAYQLRLRNCGGIIVLDLIDMEKEENKQRVYRALEEALRKDRARPTIQKISELGLIEMTRKRTRDTMVRALCEACSHCEGKGFVKSRQTVAYEVLRDVERDGIDRDVTKILVQAHSEVIDLLAIDERETLDQLERRFRKPIYLQAMGDFHMEQFEVIAESTPGRSARERVGRDRERDRERDRRNERQKERERMEKEREKEREAVRARLEAQRQSRAIQAADMPAMVEEMANEPAAQQAEGGGQRHQRDRDGGRDRDRNRDRNRNRDRGERHQNRDDDRQHGRDQERQPQPQPQIQIQTQAQAQVQVQQGQTSTDPDMIGNRADVPTHLQSATTGFQQTQGGPRQQPGWDEEMDEEDRLAYLRAQAAQDAAIANLSRGEANGNRGPGGPRHQNGGGGGGGGGGGRGGRDRDRRGGRRGGRDRDRGRDRNRGGGGGGGRQAHGGGSGGGGVQPRRDDTGGNGGGGNGGGGGTSGGNGGGGEGGHSQPPVE